MDLGILVVTLIQNKITMNINNTPNHTKETFITQIIKTINHIRPGNLLIKIQILEREKRLTLMMTPLRILKISFQKCDLR